MTRRNYIKTTWPFSSRLAVLAFLFCAVPAAHSISRPPQQMANNVSRPAAAANDQESGVKEILDLEVYNQDGKKLRFYSDLIKGRLVAINFLFTSCKSICPMQGESFSRLQAALAERLGKDVYLISISTDPETDSPRKLKRWGKLFGAKDGWTFVTGKKKNIEKILEMLGGSTTKEKHSPIVLIGHGDKAAWIRDYGLADPNRLINLIDEVMGKPTVSASKK